MAKTTVEFESHRTPEAALEAFAALAGERGWRVLERSEGSVVAKRPINLKTWGDRITVGARPGAGAGSVVHVLVSSWQLVDWGAGKGLAEEVRRRVA
ncbi:hypothetical protein [Patulibacter sp.]|uniref:hypothetical protein n=1 Tax=Patulibacter sp. TaxID=1912859 RepID=UPI0027273F22|nr:hypothetical protein [Patulibacter sp.]MDO9408362.1 hypothetical protein [Patulibacter sp.]